MCQGGSGQVMRTAAVAFVCALSVSMAAPVGAQQRVNARFVRALGRPSQRHPLADSSGKLPVMLWTPRDSDAAGVGAMLLGGGISAIRLAPEEVSHLEASHPELRFSVGPPRHLVLDQSAKWNGTEAYRARVAGTAGEASGTGKGVLVGVIDSGIDAAHEDFRDETGKTRIAWMLDLSHGPIHKHPELEQAFGCTDPKQVPCAVLSEEDINAALAGDSSVYLPTDNIGHGTHVASIAAGDGGRGPAARYRGGAPNAKFIIAGVTHGANDSVSDPDIANGARFIFDRADNMPGGPLPISVNLSLGGDFGPHDGTTALEKTLVSMVGASHPGHALIVAAGNSGDIYEGDEPGSVLGIHTQVRVTPSAPLRVPMRSPTREAGGNLNGSVYICSGLARPVALRSASTGLAPRSSLR